LIQQFDVPTQETRTIDIINKIVIFILSVYQTAGIICHLLSLDTVFVAKHALHNESGIKFGYVYLLVFTTKKTGFSSICIHILKFISGKQEKEKRDTY